MVEIYLLCPRNSKEQENSVAPVWLKQREQKARVVGDEVEDKEEEGGKAISYKALLIIERTLALSQGEMESHSTGEY